MSQNDGFSKSTAALAKTFMYRAFDSEEYARSLSAQSDGDKDLIEKRAKISQLNDETCLKLKKQVYLNYKQFIEAAREISQLESEMFKINHILTEQKTIMDNITKLFSEETFQEAEKRNQKSIDESNIKHKALTSLVGRVEGCSEITQVEGRYLIHDGDVTELDPNDFNQVAKLRLFLLNDSILIARQNEDIKRNKREAKLKFEALYLLDNLAIVNVRDIGPTKNAIKILIFPDQRLFQCPSAKEKRQWLEMVEESKKSYLAFKATKAPDSISLAPTQNESNANPFGDDSPNDSPDEDRVTSPPVSQNLPEWVIEAPEEIDVLLAQREFVEAQKLLLKAERIIQQESQSDINRQLNEKRKNLIEILSNELCPAADRSLRAGARGQRLPAKLLIELGQERKAAKLFLKSRSEAQRYSQKSIRIEGNLLLYSTKFSRSFFDHLRETAKEFNHDFDSKPVNFSALVVWTKSELSYFVSQFSLQVFQSNVDLSDQAECFQNAMQCAQKLTTMGLDVEFILNHQLRKPVLGAIIEHKNQIVEAIGRKAAMDEWRPLNLQTSNALDKVKEEMASYGITNFGSYCKDPCFVRLSQTMISYTRQLIPHCHAVIKMYSEELYYPIIDSISELLKLMIKILTEALKSIRDSDKSKVVRRSAKFLATELIPYVQLLIKEKTDKEPNQIREIEQNFKDSFSA